MRRIKPHGTAAATATRNPASDAGASANEGLGIAVDEHGSIVLQMSFSAARLARFSPEIPPSMTLRPDVALVLVEAILRELRPDLAAALAYINTRGDSHAGTPAKARADQRAPRPAQRLEPERSPKAH